MNPLVNHEHLVIQVLKKDPSARYCSECLARLAGIKPAEHYIMDQLYLTKWYKLLKNTICKACNREELTYGLNPE